jgi:rod shape-determining protein MreC
MASSRDDFIIAIRSAFLKKSTQQKFSLLTLVFISIFIIVLSSFDLKFIRYLKAGISEVVYRSSFIVSIPENFLKNTFFEIREYSTFFQNYKINKEELNELKSKSISDKITQFENEELKELINDYTLSSDKLLAKIIVDHDSPYLKSIIINKGSKDNIKIGTNIYDRSYLVGRVVEVNYKTSRVLLLSDLNSNVPVTIAPQNIQAIITGTGENYGEIKYTREGISNLNLEDSIVYTSGTGAIFKSGTPIGRVVAVTGSSNRFKVDFYSDFSQLKYIFAELVTKTEVKNEDQQVEIENSQINNTADTKLQILEDEKKIIEQTNLKFKDENELLKIKINNLNKQIVDFRNEVYDQKQIIAQYNIDLDEIEFLRLNLKFGHTCRKSFLNNDGFEVGTSEYKSCVMNKGQAND